MCGAVIAVNIYKATLEVTEKPLTRNGKDIPLCVKKETRRWNL
jgi:hypothetical protein